MPDYELIYKRVRKYILYLLAFYVLGWGFTSLQSIFLGLILGTALSLFNLWLLVRKIKQFGEVVVNGGKKNSRTWIIYKNGNSRICCNSRDGVSRLYPSCYCGYWLNDILYCHYDRYIFDSLVKYVNSSRKRGEY